MAEDAAALQWARGVEDGSQLRWGAIEEQVLAHEPLRSETPAWASVLGVIGAVGSSVLLVPLAGAPVIALVLLLVALSRPVGDVPDGLITATTLVFAFTSIMVIAALRAWWNEGRQRNVLFAGFGAVAFACGGVGLVLSVLTDRQLDLDLVRVVTAVTTVASIVVLALAALSRPGAPSQRPPRRGPRGDRSRRRYLDTRARVLDVLLDRGLVSLDSADRQRMNEMPLGYWEELDGVDDRERRRILELRIVGWREFDDRERRT